MARRCRRAMQFEPCTMALISANHTSGENRAGLPAAANRRTGYGFDRSGGLETGRTPGPLLCDGGGVPRLIILSFLFMALAFYELSGGADFVPRGVRPPKPEPQLAEAAPRPELKLAPPVLAPRKFRMDDPKAEEIGKERRIAALKAQQAERAERLAQLRQGMGSAPGGGLVFYPGPGGGGADGGAGGIELGSLQEGAAGLHETAPGPEPVATPAPAPEPEPDIREVTGTRVNMRDGPGTIYAVVLRLSIGQKVEVLGTSGTGWLRLRTLPGRQIGWVAASLVSKAAE